MGDSRKPKQQAEEASSAKASRAVVRNMLLRIAGVCVGLVLGVLTAEIGLRAFDIRPERYSPPQVFGWDGTQFRPFESFGGWGKGVYKNHSRFEAMGVNMGEHIPGTRLRVEYASNPRGYFDENNGVTYDINSHGLHGPEITKEKPVDTFRILGIGDSFTFGQGVKEQDTFLRRLDRSLNTSPEVVRPVEVLNAGVLGYNTRDEVVYLEHQWLEYDPDLVLIAFYLNDAYSDFTFVNNGGGLGIYYSPEGLARQSYLVDLVQHSYRARTVQRELEDYYRGQYFSEARKTLAQSGTMDVDWKVSSAALERAAELGQRDGFLLALIIFPEFYHLDDRYPFFEIHELVKEKAISLSIPVLDLMMVYRGLVDRDLWVHPSDHHPNEVAHKLAAEAIEPFLWENGLLEKATVRE